MRKSSPVAKRVTLADFLNQLGGIAPSRVRWQPRPGEATEEDVTFIWDREKRRCELIDRVLVEKVMGFSESVLALWLGYLFQSFLEQDDLGFLVGPSGAFRFTPGQVRYPDLSFVRWDRLPNREIPDEPIPDLAPNLAIEILSKGNTKGEMDRKLRDYLISGVRLVWYVNPVRRSVRVYTAPDQVKLFGEGDTLDGGDVLPGLTLPVNTLFQRLPPKPAKRRKGGNGR